MVWGGSMNFRQLSILASMCGLAALAILLEIVGPSTGEATFPGFNGNLAWSSYVGGKSSDPQRDDEAIPPGGRRGLSQHENGFLALRVSLAGGREANLFDDEAALLEYPEGGSVTGSGAGDQRTFGDFPEQQV